MKNELSQRNQSILSFYDTQIAKKTYLSNMEILEVGDTTTHIHYIFGGDGLAAFYLKKEGEEGNYYFAFKDYLGSILTLTDKNGNVVQEQSFDAWGRYRNTEDWSYDNVNPPTLANGDFTWLRGYTGHEYLPQFSLIHMNGRLYDPYLGRMLSPDNFVHTDFGTQGYNRYSYAANNPLKYTDPSGDILVWSLNKDGFSLGLNFTPSGFPLGFGINSSWSDGFSLGVYVEAGPRVGGGGIGSGLTVSQSLDYNFKHENWSTTTSEGVYFSYGSFNAGISLSQSYDISNDEWNKSWGLSAGFGFGNDEVGAGFNIGHGSGGFTFGVGGYYISPRPEVYHSPVSDNYGDENGECVYRCFEEFSKSYGIIEHDFEYWIDQNNGKLGVKPLNISKVGNKSSVYTVNKIDTDISSITDALTNNKRVLMAFEYRNELNERRAHAVMVRKVKVWPNGRFKIWYAETSKIYIVGTPSYLLPNNSGFWEFHPY